jgi:hypothetical protein
MDWWCLGLLMHEMLAAKHPYHGPSHYDTLRNMVTKQPAIDSRVTQKAAVVIRGLLVKSPRTRLCCKSGLSELKELPFFSAVDWDAIYNKTIPVGHIPALANMEDTSSFEESFTREAAVDSIDYDAAREGRKGGGIMGLFGFNMQGDKKGGDSGRRVKGKGGGGDGGDGAFAGFSFAKEDIMGEDGEGEGEGVRDNRDETTADGVRHNF